MFRQVQQHNRCGFKPGGSRPNPHRYTILVVNAFNPFIYNRIEVIIVRLKT